MFICIGNSEVIPFLFVTFNTLFILPVDVVGMSTLGTVDVISPSVASTTFKPKEVNKSKLSPLLIRNLVFDAVIVGPPLLSVVPLASV